jgi:ubiquinone/menaquinone biosynthesis C-methylase UbiE
MSSERQIDNENNPWWGEHLHRYEIALKYISANDVVLDLACGNGFGTSLLSRHSKNKVIGGDISAETIAYCKQKWKSSGNLHFQLIDGTNSKFSSDYFDSVVSFETIEHTTQYMDMLKEFNRITKKGGTVILSTPNKKISSPDGIVRNPYHTQEFLYDELSGILNTVFDEVKLYGQKYVRYERKTLRNKLGSLVEKVLYTKGIRKLPIPIQDFIMKRMIGKQMYPTSADYDIVTEKKEVLKCKTFFAICKKNG